MTDFDESPVSQEAEKKRKELEQREINDIRHVMAGPQGRRVVWSILEKGRVFSSTFSPDQAIAAFNEGQRNIALALFQRVMTHCPEKYLVMADEASKED